MFYVSAKREKIDTADLNRVIADGPNGAEILRRLGKYGRAGQAVFLQTDLDLRSDQKLMTGGSVPVVQDLVMGPRGDVTPSVTYQNVGTKVDVKSAVWQRAGDKWVCDASMKLESAAVNESGVKASSELELPTFGHVSLAGQRRFQSGRPEYAIVRGAPTPSDENKAVVCVVRMVLTRPE